MSETTTPLMPKLDISAEAVEEEILIQPMMPNLGIDIPNKAIEEMPPRTYYTSAPLPTLDDSDYTPRPPRTFGDKAGEFFDDVAYRLSPFTNIANEIANSVNATVYGGGYNIIKAIVEPIGIDMPPKPSVFENHSYISNPDARDFYDKTGDYIAIGGVSNAVAKKFVNQLGQNFFKYTNSGKRLNPNTGKPFTEVEGKRVGILRTLSEQPLRGEVDLAMRMATGGVVASELTGSDSLAVTIPAEILSGVLFRGKNTYFDVETGFTRDVDTGQAVANEEIINQFLTKFKLKDLDTATSIVRSNAVDPYEALLALRALEQAEAQGIDSGLSVAQNMNDSGLFILQRALGIEDPIFAGRIDQQLDHIQFSLSKELNELLNPNTGTYNWEALERVLPQIEKDLLSEVDDRVRIARESLEALLPLYKGDVTKMSDEFALQFKKLYDDVNLQEDVLWSPITKSGLQLDTVNFKKAILDILEQSNSQTKIPVKEFSEYLGKGLVRTADGWKAVPLNLKGDKKKLKELGLENTYFPEINMGDKQSPQVLKTIRTTMNNYVRNNTDNQYDMNSLIKAQQAAVDVLTDNQGNVPERFKTLYLTATQFSKKVHNTFKGGGIISKVVTADPEKKLEIAVGGGTKSETTMNVVAREFDELMGLSAGELPPTPRTYEAQSGMLKSAEQYLLDKFAKEVDVSDVASFDLFLSTHKTWIQRFPELGKIIREARVKAIKAGAELKDAEQAQQAANLDIFASLTGQTPDVVMDNVLKSANPLENARRLRLMLNQDKEALAVFQDGLSRRIVAQAMENVALQVKGVGRNQEVATRGQLERSIKQLDPLISVFKTTEQQKGLDLLLKRLKAVENDLSSRGSNNLAINKMTNLAMQLTAKLAGVTAVNKLFGSQSIVLAGASSKVAESFVQNLTFGQTNAILKEAYKNPELMKILLSREITDAQLQMLKSKKFKTGQIIFRGLVGEAIETSNQPPVIEE